MQELQVGATYQHYKGGMYLVIAEGLDSETQTPVVIYKSIGSGQVWVRPKAMFLEQVVVAGHKIWRFAKM